MRREIKRMDPEREDSEIARIASEVLYGDPFFTHSVFLITFARQAAVPEIARALYRSGNGDVIKDPVKRTNDTIIFFSEFFRRGYRSDEGRAAIARMERIHANFLIDDDLKLYTLATVMFEPDRLAEQFGWVPFVPEEQSGRWNFWKGFAAAIPLSLPGTTHRDFIDWMREFERVRYEYSEDGARIFDALVRDWQRWFPSWLPRSKKIARQSLIGLLDDHTRDALGLRPAGRMISAMSWSVAHLYLRSTAIRPMRRDRSLIDYFGSDHLMPRDLETVGHNARPATEPISITTTRPEHDERLRASQ